MRSSVLFGAVCLEVLRRDFDQRGARRVRKLRNAKRVAKDADFEHLGLGHLPSGGSLAEEILSLLREAEVHRTTRLRS